MFSIYQNTLQEVFNASIDEYCRNSAFSSDVHSSINLGQRSIQGSLRKSKLNPLGTSRSWSKVEKEIVDTFNDFVKEYIRQIDLHFKTFNKYLTKESVDLNLQGQDKKAKYQKFVAREELSYWQDFPRNKKFYHSYLRKLYTLFNQCKMPPSLSNDNIEKSGGEEAQKKEQKKLAAKQKAYIRDIQLIMALCLDLMPQMSQDYQERIESPQPLSSIIQNVWELTEFYGQTIMSNESRDSREMNDDSPETTLAASDSNKQKGQANKSGKSNTNVSSGGHSHGETILSGGTIMSCVGGLDLEGLKATGIDMSMDKEARHLRKYLYQNRMKFDNVVEELKMFDAENLKNWAILGNLMTIMVSDVIQIFLSTQENIKITHGLVDALMTYSSLFSNSFRTIDSYQALPGGTKTIFDLHQRQIQDQWAQIFGQISKLSSVTFDTCLSFLKQAMNQDHSLKKREEDIEELAEQIFHCRFLHIQPAMVDQALMLSSAAYQKQVQQLQATQTKKAAKVIELFNEILAYLNGNGNAGFKLVLLRTLRHLIAQLNFRDAILLENNEELRHIWSKAIQNVYQYVDKVMITSVFPDVGRINLEKKVASSHWDRLLATPFNRAILALVIQIIKVSEQDFYNDALVRLMNWICLPQMLDNRKTFEFARRILMELYTPELYKQDESLHWQPRILNHIYFLEDTEREFCQPIVAHTDLQVFNQMPHRSPGLLNNENPIYNDPYEVKLNHFLPMFKISLQETFPIIFHRKNMDPSAAAPKGPQSYQPEQWVLFIHKQYLDLLAIYDLKFLQATVIPELLSHVDGDSLYSLEMVLLALQQIDKILDPSLNFRQKYMTVHTQIADKYKDRVQLESFLIGQHQIYDQIIEKLKNYVENALILIIQSPLYSGIFLQDSMDFFRSSQYRELCNDKMGAIWPSPSLSVMKESEFVSRFLKKTGFADYLIEKNSSQVTFEDHIEIQGHHFTNPDILNPAANAQPPSDEYGEQNDDAYGRHDDFFVIPNEQYDPIKDKEMYGNLGTNKRQNEYIQSDMNQIKASLEKELGLQCDKKKESYIRHRLMCYLAEDRSQGNKNQRNADSQKKKGESVQKGSWTADSGKISDKQKHLMYGENLCPKRLIQVQIRVQITQMLHYLPKVFSCQYLNQNICKDLLLIDPHATRLEKDKIQELTDQTRPIQEILGLAEYKYVLDEANVDSNKTSQNAIGSLRNKLISMSKQYNKDYESVMSPDDLLMSQENPKRLGGTHRLTKPSLQQERDYDRLKNISKNILAYGILSVDAEISSKTSKLLQKLMIFGNLEIKIMVIDQIVYLLKEMMIEQLEEYHLPMLLQQLVSCVKLWHHAEIHKVRIRQGPLREQLKGIQFVNINSEQAISTAASQDSQMIFEEQKSQSEVRGARASQTYPEIQKYLYIFDMLDTFSLLGISNKDRVARNLSLSLMQESSKLKRLIAGFDTRKSLADLLYYNEANIKDKIIERLVLLKTFKFRAPKNEQGTAYESFVKLYGRDEIEQRVQSLSFFKIVEDNFDYKQARINESLARDLAVQYVGELTTLWKNEFKSLIPIRKHNQKDDIHKRKNKEHRLIGQKLLNFMFNLSRRCLRIFEQKMDSSRVGERKDDVGSKPSGPRASVLNRLAAHESGLINSEKDHSGLNLHLALVLYNVTISSYNQYDFSKLELEGDDQEEYDDESDAEFGALKVEFSPENEDQEPGVVEIDFQQDPDHREDNPFSSSGGQNLPRRSTNVKSKEADQGQPEKHYKIQDLQHDLFNIIQLINHDPADSQRVPPGNFYPSRIAISSIILSFIYLVQSPLPLAHLNKRAQQTREQAMNRIQKKGGTSKVFQQAKATSQISGISASSSGTAVSQQPLPSKLEAVDILRLQIDTLFDIFSNQMKENLDGQYLMNSVLFYSLLLVTTDFGPIASNVFNEIRPTDGEGPSTELTHLLKKQNMAKNLELCEIVSILVDICSKILREQKQREVLDLIKSVLFNGLARIVKVLLMERNITDSKEEADPFKELLPLDLQVDIIKFCHTCSLSQNEWVMHKNRQSYQIILQYQHHLNKQLSKKELSQHNLFGNKISLDLEYMINMQNLGYDVLKYFRFDQNGYAERVQLSTREQMVKGVNDMKVLINSVYQFYLAQEDINELLQNQNPFYECFLNQIIPVTERIPGQIGGSEQLKFQEFLKQNDLQQHRFKQAYEKITKACFNLKYSEKTKQKRILIDTQVKKFVQYNIHSKVFLLTLSMTMNLRNNTERAMQSQIERSRLICLATLPLMFDDEDFREQVEERISSIPDLNQLIQCDDKTFYRFIKRMIADEETYNLQHHFEKYFAISGFTRNLLNEIIKLQSQNDSKVYSSNVMLIKVLDTLTYFMSQKGGTGIQLRRAPRNAQDQSAFLFDNLIDYKSFEFLSKLFKITEKLIEYDQDMIIMNMWYKIVENQKSNYEILAKFLIHNLSSNMIKLKQQAISQGQSQMGNRPNSAVFNSLLAQDTAQYGIDYKKQKMYSINIFNYIKARVQRADVRNSIQVSSESPTWSKKMIELLLQASLNVQSKYVLEKVKLKKILQTMHREINQTGQALRLKGGLDTEVLVMQFQDKNVADSMVNQSVRMSQLLESQTFLHTFASNKRKEQSIVQNLLFNFQRIIKEKFVKITPVSQLNQFNDLLIKYYENSLVFIANDTDRALQVIQFSKEQELTVVVVILILIGHLSMNFSEPRFKYLIDIFKTLLANMTGLQQYFTFNNLQPRQLQLDQVKVPGAGGKVRQSQFAQKVVSVFHHNFYESLFDSFDIFTKIFFTVSNNISSDSDLRVNIMDLYQQIFKALREIQKQKIKVYQGNDELNSNVMSQKAPRISQSISIIQTGKKLRTTILAILQSAFLNLHELSSVQNRIIQVNQSQTSAVSNQTANMQAQHENKQIHNLAKNFRQHVQNMMDYILYSHEIDKLRKDLQAKQQIQSQKSMIANNNDILAADMSPATRSILFASNTLFWIGISCLEAPHHLAATLENDDGKQSTSNSYLIQIQQIQHQGMVAVRRTLEETSFLKILHVFQNLSDHFYSYNLQMDVGRTSFISIILNSIKNPLCTRDALKMLILSIKIQDQRLLICKDKSSDEQDPTKSQTASTNSALAKVELIRLLYLLPYFMEQFLASISPEKVQLTPADEQIFYNKRNMILLLKKSLPSIGMKQKNDIFQRLEEIQRKTANVEQAEDQYRLYEEMKHEFEVIINQTVDLIQQQGLINLLIDCHVTFQKLLKYQHQRYGSQGRERVMRGNQREINDQPIKADILQMIVSYIDDVRNKKPKSNEEIFDENMSYDSKQFAKNKENSAVPSIFNENTEILGEEVDNYRHEFKSLYFAIKNIIVKELEYIDKDVDIQTFFDKEANPVAPEIQVQSSLSAMPGHKQTSKNRASGFAGTNSIQQVQLSQTAKKQAQKPVQNVNQEVQMQQKQMEAINKDIQAQSTSTFSRQTAYVSSSAISGEQNVRESMQRERRQTVIQPQIDQLNEPAQESREFQGYKENQQQPMVISAQQQETQPPLNEEKKYTHSPTQSRKYSTVSNFNQFDHLERHSAVDQQTSSIPPETEVADSSLRISRSKSKSRTRYQEKSPEDDEQLSQRVQILDAPTSLQKTKTAPPVAQQTILKQEQDMIGDTRSQRSFADIAKEMNEVQSSHQSRLGRQQQNLVNPNQNVFQYPEQQQVQQSLNLDENTLDNDMMTFQRRQPATTTKKVADETLDQPLQLPGSNFEVRAEQMDIVDKSIRTPNRAERQQTQKEIRQPLGGAQAPYHQSQTHTNQSFQEEDMSSRDQRRYYQAPINPGDNQSMQSLPSAPGIHAQRFDRAESRPQTSVPVTKMQTHSGAPQEIDPLEMAQYQQFLRLKREMEKQQYAQSSRQPVATQEPPQQQYQQRAAPQQIQRPRGPSALQPGFVADKSNRIWSDVASQKSQSYASYSVSTAQQAQQHHQNQQFPQQQQQNQLYQQDRSRESLGQQNQQLMNQIAQRNQQAFEQQQQQQEEQKFDGTQTMSSFKSFTQIGKDKQYDKNAPNFDFSQGR